MTARADIAAALRRLAPSLPPHETDVVLDHAVDRPRLRSAPPETAAWLSLVAYVRHEMSDYDDLLDSGYDVDSARHFVLDEMQAILAGWGVQRQIVGADLTDREPPSV